MGEWARYVNPDGKTCESPLHVHSVSTHLAISSWRIFYCVYMCVQTARSYSMPHLRNRGKEVVLAQADWASSKADGSLFTIIYSPIKHRAWSTYDTVSPPGKK